MQIVLVIMVVLSVISLVACVLVNIPLKHKIHTPTPHVQQISRAKRLGPDAAYLTSLTIADPFIAPTGAAFTPLWAVESIGPNAGRDRLARQLLEETLEHTGRKLRDPINGNWYPANGDTETPFVSRSGRRLLYCWQPSTGRHAYLDCGTDIILTDEEAGAALAL